MNGFELLKQGIESEFVTLSQTLTSKQRDIVRTNIRLTRDTEELQKIIENIESKHNIPINMFEIAEKVLPKKEETKPIEIHAIYAKDIKNIETKNVEWHIEGILPKKSICIFAGKTGTYKSFQSINIGVCIATGKSLFNKFATNKTKVLYIDEENGLSIIKERFDMIKKGLDIIEDDIGIAFTSFAGIKLDKKEWKEALEKFLQEYKPEIIIVDSYRRAVRFDENEAGEVSRFFTDTIRQLSEEYGISWIFIHHLRKGITGKNPSDELDELRGSSDLVNYADVVLSSHRNRGSTDSLIFKQLKNRYKQEMASKTIKLEWTSESLKMECVGDAEDTLFADQVCANDIMQYIAEKQITSFKRKEILLEKFSKATTDRALNLLINAGKLVKPKKGCYEIQASRIKLGDYLPEQPKVLEEGVQDEE